MPDKIAAKQRDGELAAHGDITVFVDFDEPNAQLEATLIAYGAKGGLWRDSHRYRLDVVVEPNGELVPFTGLDLSAAGRSRRGLVSATQRR